MSLIPCEWGPRLSEQNIFRVKCLLQIPQSYLHPRPSSGCWSTGEFGDLELFVQTMGWEPEFSLPLLLDKGRSLKRIEGYTEQPHLHIQKCWLLESPRIFLDNWTICGAVTHKVLGSSSAINNGTWDVHFNH